jgi:hypothetical protein
MVRLVLMMMKSYYVVRATVARLVLCFVKDQELQDYRRNITDPVKQIHTKKLNSDIQTNNAFKLHRQNHVRMFHLPPLSTRIHP